MEKRIFASRSIQIQKKMKKGLLLAASAALLFGSCIENDGTHYTELIYPSQGGKVLYADQTNDSLKFITFDPWSIDTLYRYTAGKLRISLDPSDLAGDVPSGYYVNKTVKFTFAPNTSDTIKSVSLILNSNNYKFESIYYQVNYLNIERPVMDRDDYSFELTDSATTTLDSICFVAYGDWQLEVINPETTDWITLTKNNGSKGNNTVPLKLTVNDSEAARLATLKLTSNGASTPILVKQMAGKKEE